MQPVEAPMGSMIIWGDHTWHGSYPRTTEGLRLMMLGTYCRSHMQTQEPFRQTVTQEALDRNPIRFGRLMDVAGGFPFGKSPPRPPKPQDKPARQPESPTGYISLFDKEPAAGAIKLRPQTDFDAYDKEFAELIAKRGAKIQFPDMYRAPPRKADST